MFFSMVATQEAQVIPLIETINLTTDSTSSSKEFAELPDLCFTTFTELTDDDLLTSERQCLTSNYNSRLSRAL